MQGGVGARQLQPHLEPGKCHRGQLAWGCLVPSSGTLPPAPQPVSHAALFITGAMENSPGSSEPLSSISHWQDASFLPREQPGAAVPCTGFVGAALRRSNVGLLGDPEIPLPAKVKNRTENLDPHACWQRHDSRMGRGLVGAGGGGGGTGCFWGDRVF